MTTPPATLTRGFRRPTPEVAFEEADDPRPHSDPPLTAPASRY
ncbi:hypothetical protein [Microbacterium elymi]|uniref:Uncharacterized protein n=1 Tax=Microbacterium elymi TaxID=2909587 RepID=A0ABY5NIG8_9MICO|nr:hypothetical protein [Microbacterium elymi]UUT34904.1 hypothetical protein L2X98_31390 [Microbacterium elymi]